MDKTKLKARKSGYGDRKDTFSGNTFRRFVLIELSIIPSKYKLNPFATPAAPKTDDLGFFRNVNKFAKNSTIRSIKKKNSEGVSYYRWRILKSNSIR